MQRLSLVLRKWWLFLCLVPLFSILYLANIDGWLMDDDEGTDFYEVWQLQEGQQPGINYLAEQQPLYLLIGRFLLGQSHEPEQALRAFAAVQVLAAAFILTLAVNMIWGKNSAILSTGILLGMRDVI